MNKILIYNLKLNTRLCQCDCAIEGSTLIWTLLIVCVIRRVFPTYRVTADETLYPTLKPPPKTDPQHRHYNNRT